MKMAIDSKSKKLEKQLFNSPLRYCLFESGIGTLNYRALLGVDTALQLKQKGYSAVIAIKNAGISAAEIFRQTCYDYFEIDYSHYKRSMVNPEMEEKDLNKLKGQNVVLADIDFVSGNTLRTCKEYLNMKDINNLVAYIAGDQWRNETDVYLEDWEINNNGLRTFKENEKYSVRRLPDNLKIYTFTDWDFLESAKQRVLDYIQFKEIFSKMSYFKKWK